MNPDKRFLLQKKFQKHTFDAFALVTRANKLYSM